MVMEKSVSLSFWTFSDSFKTWHPKNSKHLKIKEVGEATRIKADGEEVKGVLISLWTISLKTGISLTILGIKEVIGEEIKAIGEVIKEAIGEEIKEGSMDNKVQDLDLDIDSDLGYKHSKELILL
jgi:hypothetical protein